MLKSWLSNILTISLVQIILAAETQQTDGRFYIKMKRGKYRSLKFLLRTLIPTFSKNQGKITNPL